MVYQKDTKLIEAIIFNVADAYHYGFKDYTGEIHMVNCVEDYFDVDITFENHTVEICVRKKDSMQTITLPYGIHGQSNLIIMIQTAIDLLTFKLQGDY